jgi:hypothetical protein
MGVCSSSNDKNKRKAPAESAGQSSHANEDNKNNKNEMNEKSKLFIKYFNNIYFAIFRCIY